MRWRYTVIETSGAEVIFVPCTLQVQTVYSEKHPSCHSRGAGKLLWFWGSSLSFPQFAWVKLYLDLWKIWWRGRQVLRHCVSDPFTLHKNNFGGRIMSWSLIQSDCSSGSRSAKRLLTMATSSNPSCPSHYKRIWQILPLAGNQRWILRACEFVLER